jgi:membrane associated rhomboid family serine protease
MSLFNRNPLDWDRLSFSLRSLIIANLIAFLLQWVLEMRLPIVELFSLIPYHVTHDFWLWQLATYMFLHGGVLHLFFNMLMLWMFGNVLEAQWGSAEFLKYYFICGIGAAVTSVLFGTFHLLGANPLTPTIGASGAIFGLLVAFGMVYPEAVVYVWFFIPMTARSMAVVFGALELVLTLSSSRSGVAGFAHIGGMLTGYLYLKWGWRMRNPFRSLSRAVAGGVSGAVSGAATAVRRKRRQASDDLENEVNRILDKVLVEGEQSLTAEEREVMRRYAKKTQH